MYSIKSIRIVILEDDRYYNRLLTRYVETICHQSVHPGFQFEIKSYTSADECVGELDEQVDVILLDYYLSSGNDGEELNGSDVVREVKKYCPKCKIIMISAMRNSYATAELMKEGVFEYIDKNVNSKDRVGAVLQKALFDGTNQVLTR